MIFDQAEDIAVSSLLAKVSDIYCFMLKDDALARIPSMPTLYGKIARQTLECADFIVHYSEAKSVWIKLGKHILNETNAMIKSYSNVLDHLMEQFRGGMVHDTVAIVHCITEDKDFRDMVYADGAGRGTSKCCLPGTRENILSDIKDWIDNTGERVPQVLWLSGTTGKGKSTIALTIANWFDERGGSGAYFCFDRTRNAERRHEKLFTTIARDLADRDPIIRRALACVVRDDDELRHTRDITKQWEKFVLAPVDAALKAVNAPVLVIIDSLDESGDARSRKHILRVLAGKPDTFSLPANIRVVVTSRPLEDIRRSLCDTPHVRHVSLDVIPPASTEGDIQLYITAKLECLSDIFHDTHFQTLARKSDGLFEWARLACEYIKDTNKAGVEPMDRFDEVTTGSKTGTRLLDDMYVRILAEIMPQDKKAIARVSSVMGQILASLEPLSMASLTAMRLQFPGEARDYKMERVIIPLKLLFTGTTDSHSPIRPRHASFYDFLTDKSRSGKFFVDVSLVTIDVAFASIRVMKAGLYFNICSLESSYFPNSAVPDLEERVKKSISAELSYSSRFWGTHVRATFFNSSLAEEITSFFDKECLLFWLEALALMKDLSSSMRTLSSVADWLTGHAKYRDTIDAVRDTQRFVRTFAPVILHSTPHLYLSALPFAPTQSTIFKKFATKFLCTPRVVAGHVVKWPLMEKILHENTPVNTVAISPGGRHIVCGLDDETVQVWDMEIGEALGSRLRGHTGRVRSVAISPDGTFIVSGSDYRIIQVWDMETGETLGAPLQGHTDRVRSVAISPDGKYIVSGSADMTIRLWDRQTGRALDAPLQGHTGTVLSVAISPDGNRIASGSDDMTVRLWDMKTGKALGAPLQGHAGPVLSVAISPDGKFVVSVSSDETVRRWDMETGRALGAPFQGHTGQVLSVAISPDGRFIVSGSSDETIRVWDVETGKTLGVPLLGHTGMVRSVAISPDRKHIVSGSSDATIRVWDAEPGEVLGVPQAFQRRTASEQVLSIAISPGGRHIVSGSADMMIRVWDAETGEALVAPLQGHTDRVRSVAISPDGNRIASGSDDMTIRLWDMKTGEALDAPLQGHTGPVLSVAISPDGKLVVTGSSDKTIRLWDMEAERACSALLQGHTDRVLSVAVSPDGRFIVSGSSDKTIRRWDMTGKALGVPFLGHTDQVWSVTISPDGGRIVSGSSDKTIRVWDVVTGEALGAPLQGHIGRVLSVAISLDGKHIVSVSDDMTIRVWDAETGKVVCAPLRGHTDYIRCIAIFPDGNRVISGSDDKTIRVWDISQPFATTFSSNSTHTLCPPSFSHSHLSALGWVLDHEGRLLLWIPIHFHPVVYAPGNTLVIPDDALQLDLSHFAHGNSWNKCSEQEAVLSL
ncbi:WD40 repeat-like protein [Rhizopogon vinicolor AM-OR11-026]|uniref:WD40 repeat-like protein n=1 Tax=Rhizopogon vinicolor AM-OR11-026 TaxID=1314800 RepID=A0A1B7MMG1_9AGAM|nr:WD40 repeat-like protein [Rhizopogon vinicolor AM-OR11-026]